MKLPYIFNGLDWVRLTPVTVLAKVMVSAVPNVPLATVQPTTPLVALPGCCCCIE